MELVHAALKVPKFTPEDVISSMPEDVITHILDRMPIRDAVRTSILSRNWKFKWTMLTHLVFDEDFFEYPLGTNQKITYDGRILSRFLHHFEGAITKFVLYIPRYIILDVEDINHWVMLLSRKSIKEFTLENKNDAPLKLPTHLFSCSGLTHLRLFHCHLHFPPSFHGFPNLLSLDLCLVRFESSNCEELITRSPLLEILSLKIFTPLGTLKLVEIAKLKNLKILYLRLYDHDDIAITSSSIFQLVGSLPNLEKLNLDLLKVKFTESDARKTVSFPYLRTLDLGIDFSSGIMLSFAFQMIWSFPNSQTLQITGPYINSVVPPAICYSEVENCYKMGLLQLRSVVFDNFRGSKNEICLIKHLPVCAPLLKKMEIRFHISLVFGGIDKSKVAKKLSKLQRASPIAKVTLRPYILKLGKKKFE